MTATPPGGEPWPGEGRTTFEWHESGAHLLERSTVDQPEFPDGIAIIGCDAANGTYYQLYSDDRGVCRIYEMSIGDGEWKLWREGAPFPQRFTGRFSGDGTTIVARWEKAEDGTIYQTDLTSPTPASGSEPTGFRLRYPLERPEDVDGIAAFVGADDVTALGVSQGVDLDGDTLTGPRSGAQLHVWVCVATSATDIAASGVVAAPYAAPTRQPYVGAVTWPDGEDATGGVPGCGSRKCQGAH